MNKVLSLYVVGLLLFSGVILITGCNTKNITENPIKSGEILKFDSVSDLEKFLREKSLNTPQIYGRGLMTDMVKTASSSQEAGASDYSQTNIQIKGVDEADFVKNDNKYIYLIQNNKLIIIDAFDKKEIISETELPKNFYSTNIFLYNNKIVIIGQSNEESFYFMKYDIMPQPYYESFTNVLIYDVSDKENPKFSESFRVTGDYFQSRLIDNKVYLISIKYAEYPVRPPIIYSKNIITPNIYYFDNDEEQYNYNTITSIDLDIEKIIDSKVFLLGYGNTLMMTKNNIYIAYQKQRFFCRWYCEDNSYEKERFTEVVVPLLEGQLKYDIEKILRSEASDDEQWRLISERLKDFFEKIKDDENAQEEYSLMLEKIQDALNEYDTKKMLENSKTTIHKINIEDGKINYFGKGEVDGRLLNQFSLDEYEGYLRVATTVDLWINSNRKTYNNVYVLDENMNIVGLLEDIARNETIYSTRFMNDKLYMVTFKQIDPFFVIDLSNPEKPKVLGKLKIPGYSNYLHPYKENFIIGIGKETGENQWGGISAKGVKISLFDVTDVENPVEVDKYEIGMEGTDSPILYDHKAFLLFNNILVIPISEITSKDSVKYNYKYWDGAYVFEISEKGFNLLGKIKHDSRSSSYYTWWDRASVTRSIIMDNELFTISKKYIKINDLKNELQSIGSIELPYDEIVYKPYYK
ncbi:MAG: beta-propeller domain-containing protein [Candidatus Woesearchaeota archaeon]